MRESFHFLNDQKTEAKKIAADEPWLNNLPSPLDTQALTIPRFHSRSYLSFSPYLLVFVLLIVRSWVSPLAAQRWLFLTPVL